MVPRVPGRGLFKFLLVLGLALAALQMVSPSADAAENKPRVECGQRIHWDGSFTYGPDNAFGIITWAYLQVAPVTNTAAIAQSPQDVNWEWHHSLSGGSYLPNETYLDSSIFGNHEFWTHTFDGEANYPDAHWKQEVLRLVVADFGVKSPTSTAAGLSPADRSALKAVCAAQAEAKTAKKEAKGDTNGEEEPAADDNGSGDTGDDESDRDDEAAAAPATPGGGTGLWVLLALLAPLFAYALFGDKVLALVRRNRKRDTTGEAAEVPAG